MKMAMPPVSVSTHSRLKAAGVELVEPLGVEIVSTHSRLKAAGVQIKRMGDLQRVSTHSRLKAAGRAVDYINHDFYCFNTQPPEGGWITKRNLVAALGLFQHTAA